MKRKFEPAILPFIIAMLSGFGAVFAWILGAGKQIVILIFIPLVVFFLIFLIIMLYELIFPEN